MENYADRIEAANKHIDAYVISNEDWHDADEAKKIRLMNSADRTLHNKFKGNEIPDNAIYEFSAFLAIVYNDTNKMQQQGIASFSVTGVGSFTFKENNVKNATGQSLSDIIPDSVIELIEEVNDSLHLSGRNVGWMV
ncbi:hypothetical protein P4279_30120 [Bacillus thuringiensis]|uniref:hypothetical protein n=1 Tax=Bacillus wiedmannii TaxID=1890302 RepID=UPI002E2331F8|nr:hypothetical protein [Bacillus wiedmannii]MED2760453.1 hypothetical protein [Bacillus thuringiensis]MED2789218.1 hypothetical protein [Bacillus thuringiensis]MED2806658.1 hypothetical protein [Bacillus thuringiensis]MED2828965.1 hypothetical protein [Bacillus thuringiensis]MED2856424.1 hypothetical protein [Bacillus thuringiensis]